MAGQSRHIESVKCWIYWERIIYKLISEPVINVVICLDAHNGLLAKTDFKGGVKIYTDWVVGEGLPNEVLSNPYHANRITRKASTLNDETLVKILFFKIIK